MVTLACVCATVYIGVCVCECVRVYVHVNYVSMENRVSEKETHRAAPTVPTHVQNGRLMCD